MQWVKRYLRVPKYRHTSCNQHGCRFKLIGKERLSVANISCKANDTNGMTKLILLSHTLDMPVRYDFDEHEAYIEVVSSEALEGCI